MVPYVVRVVVAVTVMHVLYNSVHIFLPMMMLHRRFSLLF